MLQQYAIVQVQHKDHSMSIRQIDNNGGIIATGTGVEVFQLLSVRAALRLEKAGMKHRGGSLRKGWAVRLGLKPSSTIDKVIETIEQKVKNLKPKIAEENANDQPA